MDIEREFKELDFSGLSKVKDSLFSQLMKERTRRVELDEEDLDFLAAAGNNIPQTDSKKNLEQTNF